MKAQKQLGIQSVTTFLRFSADKGFNIQINFHCSIFQGYSNCVMVLYLLESMDKLSCVSSNLRRVLKSLADLFVLYGIAENSGSFLEVRRTPHPNLHASVIYYLRRYGNFMYFVVVFQFSVLCASVWFYLPLSSDLKCQPASPPGQLYNTQLAEQVDYLQATFNTGCPVGLQRISYPFFFFSSGRLEF